MATSTASPSTTGFKKKFSVLEDELLCSTWINLDNRMTTNFWKRVHDDFMTQVQEEANTVVERAQTDLKDRWDIINANVMDFSRYYAQVRYRDRNNLQSDAERIKDAKIMHKTMEGSSFELEHCWQILRSEPRWGEPFMIPKRAKETRKRTRNTDDDVELLEIGREQFERNVKQLKAKGKTRENVLPFVDSERHAEMMYRATKDDKISEQHKHKDTHKAATESEQRNSNLEMLKEECLATRAERGHSNTPGERMDADTKGKMLDIISTYMFEINELQKKYSMLRAKVLACGDEELIAYLSSDN